MKYVILLATILLSACSPSSNQGPEVADESPIVLEAGIGVVTGSGDFGTIAPEANKMLTFTIKNNGDAALAGPPVVSTPDFSIVYQNGCDSIGAKKTCTLKVTFDARGKAAQVHTANLTLSSVTINLTASIPAPEPEPVDMSKVSFSSGETLDFGAFTSASSVLKTITVTNISNSSITNLPISIGSNFDISYDTCSNKVILSKKTCTLKIYFNSAGKHGAFSEQLSFANSNLNLTAQVNLPGSVGGPSFADNIVFLYNNDVTTGAINIGSLVNSENKQIIINVKNTGTGPSAPIAANLSGTDFSVLSNLCTNKVLTVNSTCQIKIVFSAAGKVANTYSTSLTIGAKSQVISAVVATPAPVITYTPTYSPYGSCLVGSAEIKACDGSGLRTRSLSACNKVVNGVNQGVDLISFCAAYDNDSYLKEPCLSPAGPKQIAIAGGTQQVHCAAGSTVTIFDSVSCVAPAVQNGQLCQVPQNTPRGNILNLFARGLDGAATFTVNPAPIRMLSLTAYEYAPGTVVQVTAVPASGSSFVSFDGACSGASPTCSVTLNTSKSVTAVLEKPNNPFKLYDLNKNQVKKCMIAGQEVTTMFGDVASCEEIKDFVFSDYTCSSFGSEESCNDKPGCGWDNGENQSCSGGDESSCTMVSGCNWQPSMESCNSAGVNDSFSCSMLGNGSCMWSDNYQTESCSNMMPSDESSCTSINSNCSWQANTQTESCSSYASDEFGCYGVNNSCYWMDSGMGDGSGYCDGSFEVQNGGYCNGSYDVVMGGSCNGNYDSPTMGMCNGMPNNPGGGTPYCSGGHIVSCRDSVSGIEAYSANTPELCNGAALQGRYTEGPNTYGSIPNIAGNTDLIALDDGSAVTAMAAYNVDGPNTAAVNALWRISGNDATSWILRDDTSPLSMDVSNQTVLNGDVYYFEGRNNTIYVVNELTSFLGAVATPFVFDNWVSYMRATDTYLFALERVPTSNNSGYKLWRLNPATGQKLLLQEYAPAYQLLVGGPIIATKHNFYICVDNGSGSRRLYSSISGSSLALVHNNGGYCGNEPVNYGGGLPGSGMTVLDYDNDIILSVGSNQAYLMISNGTQAGTYNLGSDWAYEQVLYNSLTMDRNSLPLQIGDKLIYSEKLYEHGQYAGEREGELMVATLTGTYSQNSKRLKKIYVGRFGTGAGSSHVKLIGKINGKVLFSARVGEEGEHISRRQMFVTDGTEAGTVALDYNDSFIDMAYGDELDYFNSSFTADNGQRAVELNGRLYFIVGRSLWQSDGTALGTKQVEGAPHSEFGYAIVSKLRKVGNRLVMVYESDANGKGGRELLFYTPPN